MTPDDVDDTSREKNAYIDKLPSLFL